MRSRKRIVVGVLLASVCALCTVMASAPSKPAEPAPAATKPVELAVASKAAFDNVKGFLDTYCISCHSGDSPAAEILLSFKTEAEARAKAEHDADFWGTISRVVAVKEMPPVRARK